MPNLFKKFLVSFFIFLILFSSFSFLFAPKTHAAGEWYNQDFSAWYTKVYSDATPATEIFGERYTAAQVQWIIFGMWSFLLNIADMGTGIIPCFMTQSLADCEDVVKNALTENTAAPEKQETLLSKVFQDRPLSAVTYFKNGFKKFSLVPQANAQTTGFGFSALDPVLDIWKAMRNITYALFVVIIIAMSFMIMFRVKLSPQTVITVQSALPKIIMALILVTFSYAIAGLMIDLMYVIIGVISLMLSSSGILAIQHSPTYIFETMTQGPTLFGLGGPLPLRLGVFGFMAKYFLGFMSTLVIIGFAADSFFVKVGMGTIVIIMVVVLVVVLLIAWIKILWMLFKALAQIFLLTIFAPLQIMMGIVSPQMGFGSWFRSYAANLAVFPVAGTLFMFASLFVGFAADSASKHIIDFGFFGLGFADAALEAVFNWNEASWPPLLNTGDTTVAIMFLGVSFVIITIIPKSVELIQAMIKGGQFNYGSAIGDAISPITTPTSQYLSAQSAIALKEDKAPVVSTALGTLAGLIQKAGSGR